MCRRQNFEKETNTYNKQTKNLIYYFVLNDYRTNERCTTKWANSFVFFSFHFIFIYFALDSASLVSLCGKTRFFFSIFLCIRNSYSVYATDAENDVRIFFHLWVFSVRFTCAFFPIHLKTILCFYIIEDDCCFLARAISSFVFSSVDSVMVCFQCEYPMPSKFVLNCSVFVIF